MLKVSSGLLRGISLRSPSGKQTRPSSERLRQATFNVLRHYRWPDSDNILDQAIVVDLFAGTGAWGLEALSNGAREAHFVESHELALRALNDNVAAALRSFKAQELDPPVAQVIRRDVPVAYPKLPIARVLFCDPPYDLGWLPKILAAEHAHHRLEPAGILLYEARTTEGKSRDSKDDFPEVPPSLKHFDTKIYGDSSVHFFVKLAPNGVQESDISR